MSQKVSPLLRSKPANAACHEDLPAHKGQGLLSTEHVLAPFDYTSSLPSKGVRDALTDALNVWLQVPPSVLAQVKTIIGTLHNASLMLDDIGDSSQLRRGKPAAHTIFGVPSTINAADYGILRALDEVRKLPSQKALDIFTSQMQELYVGQSYDLHWSRHIVCPTEEEYLEMVDKKTGGLFRMLTQLMLAHSDFASPTLPSSLEELVVLLGRLYQIRDDYQNLASADYANQKGFCEDFDEGKFSFPVMHAFSKSILEHSSARAILKNMLVARAANGGMSHEKKGVALEQLKECGSLAYTKERLQKLQVDVERHIESIERDLDCQNWVLRLLVRKLAV